MATQQRTLKPHTALANRRGTIISFTSSPGLINLVNKYCEETGMTRSELIRELLAQLISAHYGENLERVLALDFNPAGLIQDDASDEPAAE
jgi:hypothetical protein